MYIVCCTTSQPTNQPTDQPNKQKKKKKKTKKQQKQQNPRRLNAERFYTVRDDKIHENETWTQCTKARNFGAAINLYRVLFTIVHLFSFHNVNTIETMKFNIKPV